MDRSKTSTWSENIWDGKHADSNSAVGETAGLQIKGPGGKAGPLWQRHRATHCRKWKFDI